MKRWFNTKVRLYYWIKITISSRQRDKARRIEELKERPEARNLLEIYSSLTNTTLEKSIKDFQGKNFSEFKENLSQVLVERINPISIEIKKLTSDNDFLDNILLDGYKKANNIASKKIKKMREIVGF